VVAVGAKPTPDDGRPRVTGPTPTRQQPVPVRRSSPYAPPSQGET